MVNYINEGSEFGDLHRLVDSNLTIDEFRSKMGEDKDIIVLGFTVMGKEPADDLVNFVEKSYDWVLDADLSSGETSDGNYVVFVEIERRKDAIKEIVTLIGDVINLTKQKIEDWTFTYYNKPESHPITEKDLDKYVITNPKEYEQKMSLELDEARQLNSLRALSGVNVSSTKITDMQILGLQRQAGIK
jgi:hypothetical protein